MLHILHFISVCVRAIFALKPFWKIQLNIFSYIVFREDHHIHKNSSIPQIENTWTIWSVDFNDIKNQIVFFFLFYELRESVWLNVRWPLRFLLLLIYHIVAFRLTDLNWLCIENQLFHLPSFQFVTLQCLIIIFEK